MLKFALLVAVTPEVDAVEFVAVGRLAVDREIADASIASPFAPGCCCPHAARSATVESGKPKAAARDSASDLINFVNSCSVLISELLVRFHFTLRCPRNSLNAPQQVETTWEVHFENRKRSTISDI